MYSLSDCVNYSTNVMGDCGGRVEEVNGQIVCENCRNKIGKGDPVRFQGEKYRVVKVINNGRDIVIKDIDGDTLTVSPISVVKGW